MNIDQVRQQLGEIRKADKSIALVPTMGNLHAGHLSLIETAKRRADYVVISIFVNPTQFVKGEDFNHYPRTLDVDLEHLDRLNVDMVFIPDNNEIYPDDMSTSVKVVVPELDKIHCGAFRPGHFTGVATIVTKLFNIVQPDIAVFGQKDYQQLLIIRNLSHYLNLPVEIVGGEIIREKDGLAMSSRNQYLNEEERKIAPRLYTTMCEVATSLKNTDDDYEELEQNGITLLKTAGFNPEYLKICDAKTLKSPEENRKKPANLVILAAAWLGKARLIDNVTVHTYDQRLFDVG